jgi:hypothetical protein
VAVAAADRHPSGAGDDVRHWIQAIANTAAFPVELAPKVDTARDKSRFGES